MSDAHERLRRLLFLVPYVVKHPGIPVSELATQLSVSKEELLKELDLLAFVGRPPFQPDDYIDIYVEGDRVFVDLDQRLSAPPRLTAAEAAALSAAALALGPLGGGALSSALSKLERVVPREVVHRYREMGGKISADGNVPEELGRLSECIAQGIEVEFDYFSHNRGAVERRRVQPHELFSHRGQWYLSAYCHARKDDRLFRMDRARGLQVTDQKFSPSPRQKGGIPSPIREDAEVRVRFSPQAAPYVTERFGGSARRLNDGGAEVHVSGESERWLTHWILSFGGEAQVLSPPSAREAVARAARASVESKGET